MNLVTLYAITTAAFNLPPGLLSAVCYTESKHVPQAIHLSDGGSASRGLCQLKWATAKSLGFRGTPVDLQEPTTNLYYSAKLLQYQIKRCGSIPAGVKAYNSGQCGRGSNTYVNKVFSAWEAGL